MTYRCEIREQSAQPAVAIQAQAPVQELPSLLGEAFGAIVQYLGELGQ